jgi:hypothetical protein
MKDKRSVVSGEPASTVRQRLETHLTSRGFKIEPTAQVHLLKASRGSWIGSLTSFSPKKWGARVRVAGPDNGCYDFECDVNTTGQTVTESEVEFWEAEIDGIANVIMSGDAQLGDIDRATRGNAGRVLKFTFGYAILFGGIGVMVDLANTRHGRESSWAAIGSGIGAATGASRAAKKSRKAK